MSANLATVAYIGATILFILSLGGLSNPETARRGNLYGIVGMTIAVLATVLGPRVTAAGLPYIVGALVVGGAVGLLAASGMQAVDASTTNFATFSELAFQFSLTPAIGLQALAFALVMGVVGGFVPAWRAARLRIVDCLRAA